MALGMTINILLSIFCVFLFVGLFQKCYYNLEKREDVALNIFGTFLSVIMVAVNIFNLCNIHEFLFNS